MNRFANIAAFPAADMRVVVRPNFDTLYSSGWLDLTKEPVVVSVAGYRRPLLSAADARHVDATCSPRRAGARPAPAPAISWSRRPAGVPICARSSSRSSSCLRDTQRIDAPTPYVWIIGRTKTDGPADYDAVHKIQAGYKITPLSQWGKAPEPAEVKIDPSVDMKTPPKVQVDTMPAGKFFAYAAELLKLQPPHITDQPIIARMKRIGIEPGKSFDIDKLDPAIKTGARQRARGRAEADGVEDPDARQGRERLVDEHRHHGRLRQLLSEARHRRPARPRRESARGRDLSASISPTRRGKPLDGANKYTIHFDKGATPPVDAFWSITLYDLAGFQVANAINRFAVSELDAVQVQPGRLARSLLFRTRARAQTRKPTGCRRRRGPST